MDKRMIKISTGSSSTLFIDKDEVEDMLQEYYDFNKVTESQWSALDQMVHEICSKRGIDSDLYEEYARICDICCERLCFPVACNFNSSSYKSHDITLIEITTEKP